VVAQRGRAAVKVDLRAMLKHELELVIYTAIAA